MCMDLSIYYTTTVQILIIRGSKQLDKLNYAEPTRAQNLQLRSLRRVHRPRCEWAVGRLRAEILRQVAHLKIGQGLALIKERRRLAQPVPPSPSSGTEDDSAHDSLRLGIWCSLVCWNTKFQKKLVFLGLLLFLPRGTS
jgi:hypothetical protein